LGSLHGVRKVVRLPRGKVQALFGGELQQLAECGSVDPFPTVRSNLQGTPTRPQQTIQCVHARNYAATLNAGDGGLRYPCPCGQGALAEPGGLPGMP